KNAPDVPGSGYFLLAYHPHNYAAACKTCNSPFKNDYFPIAGHRMEGKYDPVEYLAEDPFLVYPLGTMDEDPEDLIAFDGVISIPRYTSEQDTRKWKRGQVIIDFFGLNRDGLQESRAWWLLNAVWPNYLLSQEGKEIGQKRIVSVSSLKAPFTNCSRCFL